MGHFKSYGKEAASLSPARLTNTFQRVPPETTNWLAIAAPDFRGVEQQAFSVAAFEHIFSTAHAGFKMASDVAGIRSTDLHTGKLGAGVFCNDVLMSATAQLLAAKLTGIGRITFYGYDSHEARALAKADELVERCLARATALHAAPSVRRLVQIVFHGLDLQTNNRHPV